MSIIYFILGAFSRRWFGGLFTDLNVMILTNRGIQTIFMICLFMSIYVTNPQSWQNWLMALIVSCWLQFQFWSRGHSAVFDLGTCPPDDISRYKERWYFNVCEFLFKKLPDYKYGFLYDFTYMGLRYTCPMIPLAFFHIEYLLVGFSVPCVYALCWQVWEREAWARTTTSWLNMPTKWAEIIVGGIVFSSCYALGW